MKSLLAFLLALLPLSVWAQGGGPTIQAKTFIRDDGSRVEVVKNLEERTSEHKVYRSGDKLVSRTLYKLDEDGREIGGTVYNAKDVEVYRFTYKFDPNGRVSEQHDFSPDDKLIRRLVYLYRPNGQLAGVDVYDANGNLISGNEKKSNTRQRRR